MEILDNSVAEVLGLAVGQVIEADIVAVALMVAEGGVEGLVVVVGTATEAAFVGEVRVVLKGLEAVGEVLLVEWGFLGLAVAALEAEVLEAQPSSLKALQQTSLPDSPPKHRIS